MKAKTPEKPAADDGAPVVYEYGLRLGGAKKDRDAADEAQDAAPEKGRRPSPGLDGRRPPKVPAAVLAASLGERPKDERGPRQGRLRLALQVVPAVALIAVGAVLTFVWLEKNDLAGAQERRSALVGAAGKVASTFFNWDYKHMDESFAAKYPLLTEKAADAIRPTADTLTTYFTKNKVSSRADISGVYPGEIDDGAANVLVVINTNVTTAKSVQSNTGATVALSMEYVSGEWLAANITLLSPGAEKVTDENGKPLTGSGGPGAEGSGSNGSGLPGLPSSERE